MLNSTADVNRTMPSEICYIGLGSNLDFPIKQIQKAIGTLSDSDQIKLMNTSSLYKSPPMGPQEQNDYVNAVIEIETCLPPLTLLDKLQSIELSQGRLRKQERWSARTLDLDLLLYGNQIIDNDRLTVPHYGMTERAFVLYPLNEIAPELDLPISALSDSKLRGTSLLKWRKLVSFVNKMKQSNPTIEKLIASSKKEIEGINFQ